MFWKGLFTRKRHPRLQGLAFQSVVTLYSSDGKRSAQILSFENGEVYLDECEWVEGTIFENRHAGSLVGPFKSPTDAESFIVATEWFNGKGGGAGSNPRP